MNRKKLGRALLFPHIAIMLALIPVSCVFLVGSMTQFGSESPLSIASYVLAAYTLTVWCLKVPCLINFFKTFKTENRYALRWRQDERLRVNTSLYGSLLWNTAYALFQLCLGFYHHTFWYISLALYYISLAVMRFFLVRYTHANSARQNIRQELSKYRLCGWVLLFMNLALTLIIFFMIYWERTFVHHEITTIAMAAYTFYAFSLAIVNIVRYAKYQSPVYSAAKAISLAAVCVSMLTLESTMLTTFSDGTMDAFSQKLLLGLSGGAVAVFIVVMAVYMIAQSTKKLKILNTKERKHG